MIIIINKKVKEFFLFNMIGFINSEEYREKLYEANFEMNKRPARIATANYFGVDSKEVKEVLSESNPHISFSSGNSNSVIIIQALHEKEKNILSKCETLIADVFDDKIQPDFSKYEDEYKKLTGMKSLNNAG